MDYKWKSSRRFLLWVVLFKIVASNVLIVNFSNTNLSSPLKSNTHVEDPSSSAIVFGGKTDTLCLFLFLDDDFERLSEIKEVKMLASNQLY